MDSREWIEQLISRVDLAQVISRYVPLKRKGRDLWGCCPFHHEKTPSFVVHPDQGFYYCFGCHESGNAIGFVQKMESCDFWDAAKILAAEAKMDMPEFGRNKEEGIARERRERLYSVMRAAARHYHENLKGEKGKVARDYLESRGITPSLVTRFGIGVSYDGNDIIRHLTELGYTKDEMKEAGLIEQRGAEWYDVFYGRLMIPIINNMGEVIAFGGRLITPETHIRQKYRNSAKTPIFDKSKSIYAINLLKKKKQREKIDYVIITEGYMDVISLHKAGFDTAVAMMGTGLTLTQAKMLKNFSSNIYVNYDGDSAGQEAALRGLDILRSIGANVKVVTIPDDLDPDDLIRRDGREGYEKCLKEALPLPAYKLAVLKKRYDLTTQDGKAAYGIAAVKVIKSLENPVEREEYLGAVHETTGYPMDVLRRQADLMPDEEPTEADLGPAPAAEGPARTRSRAELFVIASIVHGKSYADMTVDVYPYLTDPVDRELYEYALSCFKKGEKPVLGVLYGMFGQSDVEDVVEYPFTDVDNETTFRTCVRQLTIESLTAEKKRLSEEYDKTKNAELIVDVARIEQTLKNLKNGGDNEY